ncbi:major pollen allergen Ole e 10-like [Rutidosis leptorrhynchoides]|uniref:major pollen allergen Ole e 10-like n=1 Tax=Rutidosis leptorrhynchoides TaxID=125765 RepID=UPI003A9A03B6
MASNNVTSLLFTLVFFFVISSGNVRLALGQPPTQEPAQKRWCTAKPSASNEELQKNIDFVCGTVNCDKIKPGGSCANPDQLFNRASVAMNLYYQQKGRNSWNCDFNKSGLITVTDPSYGDCKYDG